MKKPQAKIKGQPDLPVRLIEARITAGYHSPEQAAEALTFGVRTLRKYEAGVEPTAGKLRELAVVYKRSADWLLRLGRWAA